MRGAAPLAAVFAILVVLSIPAGPVGAAAASHECDSADVGVETFGAAVSDGLSLAADALGADFLAKNYGCNVFHGDRSTDSVDVDEARSELVQRSATSDQHTRVYLNSVENNLQNMRSVARLEAQAAYYRALENGSSESAARAEAKAAVRDFYTVKQIQLAASWNTLTTNWRSYEGLENNESLESSFVQWQDWTGSSSTNRDDWQTEGISIQAVNGSGIDVIRVKTGTGSHIDLDSVDGDSEPLQADSTEFRVALQNGSYTDVQSADLYRYLEAWESMQTQEDTVTSKMDDYINNTFDQYQQGDVNSSDLVTADTLTREFSPNSTSFQSWATIMYSSTEDLDPPESTDNLGEMNVSYNGQTYSGILLADTEDISEISANTTYNGSNWSTTPKIATGDSIVPLDGDFTVEKITSSDGSELNSTSYEEIKFETTNTTEYRELMDDLDALRAELTAREDALAGGGGLFGGFGGFGGGSTALILAAIAAVLLVASRD